MLLSVTKITNRNGQQLMRFVSVRCLSTATKAAPVPTEKSPQPKQCQSFMMNLFSGQIQTSQLFPYPDVLNEEHKEYAQAVIGPVNRFFQEVNDHIRNDETSNLDKKTMDAIWDLGIMGNAIPVEYGGLGLTNVVASRLGDISGGNDLALTIAIGAHQSIGTKGILLFGTEQQKAKYLPQLSSGGVIGAFALTEPSVGSDAASVKTKAVLSPCGKYYILNGSKLWCTGGGVAGIFTTFAQTEVIDPKTGEKKEKMTAFIVERGFHGVSTGPPEKKMGLKCSITTDVYFDDVKVPVENVLGEVGNGFKVAVNILNAGRYGLCAMLTGTMRSCIEKAAEHVTTRVQFKRKLEEFENVQEKLAKMAMHHYVAQTLTYMVAGNMDRGSQDYHLEAAITKVFGTEAGWYVCDEAIQLLGGNGYMQAPGLEQFMRDMRVFRIFEGANDVLRMFIALTGIQSAGKQLKGLQQALKNPLMNLGTVLQEGTKRVARTVGTNKTDLGGFVAEPLKEAAKLCSQSIDLFSHTIESVLVKNGKGIVERQFILARIADCAIDIYTMACVLSRATRAIRKGLPSSEHETLMAQAWCVEANYRVQQNIERIHSRTFQDNYSRMTQIAKNITTHQGPAHTNPLEID
ncbi:very long-chain specific acyl-CoA dehydrogenase, mitochondrial-like [Topomyia yanbarensis]|uniref:very long-chain specific acyl-CoA dehydrogenase, mitochondrial-like n=1 Tax=Topomyia yanbarensis TaxID=2498891 RepID=UPI00273B020E|nr:very long-chain specific acyl-CoA dehydrogenase, mitochondrial-like [Topomyia yanbarensis]